MSKPALILLGHGSTENPDSSDPTHRHAATLRATGRFSEVTCLFWKEQPSFHEIDAMVEAKEVYVVPVFISEGYFTTEIIPRELRLDGPVTRRPDGRIIKYCAPVGVHESMTRLLLSRAREVAPDVPPEETSVLIVGHGTKLNKNSTDAVRAQADRIREGGHGYAEVIDTYMEEPPLISDWRELTTSPNVVVVPFFIADGLHSYEDIPVMLGLETETGMAASKAEVFRHNPRTMGDRQLFYSAAIGTDPLLADVVLDQIEAFDREHGNLKPDAPAGGHPVAPLAKQLADWVRDGKRRLLEVAIEPEGAGYRLCHVSDREADPESLEVLIDVQAILEMNRWTSTDEYRERPAAPTMQRGWVVHCADQESLLIALDSFYPGAVAHWSRHLSGQGVVVPLRETLDRQTGMYQFAKKIEDDQAHALICEGCAAEKCARTILYPLEEGRPIEGLPPAKSDIGYHGEDAIPFLCVQACCFPVAGARAIVKKTWDPKKAERS